MKTATGLGFALAATFGLTGCPATELTPTCSEVQVSFSNPPSEGQQVSSPLKVSIFARTPDGVEYGFESGVLEVDGAPVASAMTADGGAPALTFAPVTLAVGGPRTLTATVSGGVCTGKSAIPSRSATVTVVPDAGSVDAGP
jgi:hypothetical protein